MVSAPNDAPVTEPWSAARLNSLSAAELRELYDALREQNRDAFRLLAENSSDIIARWSPDGVCLYISPSVTTHLGFAPEEVIAQTFLSLVHPDEAPSVEASVRDALDRGTDMTMTLRLLNCEGEYRWFETSLHAVRDGAGRVSELQTSSRDVEERVRSYQKLRRTASRLSALIDNLSGGILVEDAAGRVARVNQHFCDLFDLPDDPRAMRGMPGEEIAARIASLTAGPECFALGSAALVAQRRPKLHEELALADGRRVERDYIPVFIDSVYIGHLWHYRDITARHQAEERIRRLNEELRDANDLLRRQRDAAEEHVRKLEELNTMKSDFVSSVSHELRTPLASIMGFAQTLLIERQLPEETQQEFLTIVLEEGRRLSKLINDMLDLARIESGRISVEKGEHDLVKVIARVVDALRMQCESAGVELHFEAAEPSLVGEFDADRVSQVVMNLVGNAVKFTPRGGRVEVEACGDGRELRFVVRDTGLGIPEADLPHLFDKFYRVHRPGLEIRGTGLGLAIARQLVQLHGGTITVASSPGAGSTFTVSIPRA